MKLAHLFDMVDRVSYPAGLDLTIGVCLYAALACAGHRPEREDARYAGVEP